MKLGPSYHQSQGLPDRKLVEPLSEVMVRRPGRIHWPNSSLIRSNSAITASVVLPGIFSYQCVSGLPFHQGQQGFILLGFGTDDGVDLPVNRIPGRSLICSGRMLMLSPRIFLFFRMTLFCLASSLRKVVVLDPEEPQVDVIVDGLGAKGVLPKDAVLPLFTVASHRTRIFNHGRFA